LNTLIPILKDPTYIQMQNPNTVNPSTSVKTEDKGRIG